jgi:serine protease Do
VNMGNKPNYKLWLTGLALVGLLVIACSAFSSLPARVGELLTNQTQNPVETETTTGQDTPQPTSTPAQPVVISDGSLAAYQEALTNIYEGVSPSVVSIRVTGSQGSGQGSGFVWDLDGHIVTNHHVVDGAREVTVEFYDGTITGAEVIGSDVYSDLAVVQVDVSSDFLQPVQLTDSDQVKVGQLAIAIGNPFALTNTMTVGIVSAIGRSISAGEVSLSGSSYSIPDIIQTDAPINPGNSGGVLVDDAGRVIGVTNAIESTTGSNAGIGFAIPANIVSMVVPGLIENGAYEHPYLGISGAALYPDLAEEMGLDPEQRGALVIEVTSGGPADRAGVRGSDSRAVIDDQQVLTGGDVITAIEDQQVRTMDDLISYLFSKTKVGQTIALTILRDGKETSVDVTLAARPAQQTETTAMQPQSPQMQGMFLGVSGIDMTPEIAGAMDLPAGQTGVLVQEVIPGSPAEEMGLRAGDEDFELDGETVKIGGDVIIGANDSQITSFSDLTEFIFSSWTDGEVTLKVLRDGETIELEGTLSPFQ